MQKITQLKNCSGCHACYNACPVGCISMEYDGEGFLYPKIDKEKCINCGKCEKVCPVINEYKDGKKGTAYACINKDESVREKSSSGGVFTLIAEYVLDNGGVVFGAAFDEEFNVVHTKVDNKEDLDKLRGSKYVQSSIGSAFKQAKDCLEEGRLVLFTATPCQISGLKAFLGCEYDNLITQDIICHGVPSPKVWQKYIAFREKSAGAKTRRIFFRHKRYGWKIFSVLFEFSNNTEYIKILYDDFYIRGFLANLYLRPSCYDCHSKSVFRQSDITLADFWGIENVMSQMDDNKGTSLVLVNSSKGKQVFEKIFEKMNYKMVDIDEALKYNSSAYKSVDMPKKRSVFMKLIDKYEFDVLIKKCIPSRPFRKVFRKIKNIVKRMCSHV